MSTRLKIILLASLLIIIGFFGFYLYHQKTNDAWADSSDSTLTPLRGWAWTDTIGWISFNCCNENDYTPGCNDDCSAKYLVTVNPNDNNRLQGHAWSENVGWLSFDPSENDINCPDTNNPKICYAYYDNNKIKGWAKVLSLINSGDKALTGELYSYGWVQLNDITVDGDSNVYGISVDPNEDTTNNGFDTAWGDLSGWAWNGYSDRSGLGWFSFSGDKYKVTAQPIKPIISSVMPIDGKDDSGTKIVWNSVYGAQKYEVIRKEYACYEKPGTACVLGMNDTNGINKMCQETDEDNKVIDKGPCSVNKTSIIATTTNDYFEDYNVSYSTYEYYIRAVNLLGGIASDIYSKYTPSPISMNDLSVQGTCKASQDGIFVDLSWTSYISFGVTTIKHFLIKYCTSTSGQSCIPNIEINPPLLAPDPNEGLTKWRHVISRLDVPNTLFNNLRGQQYITYGIRAVGSDKVCIGGLNDSSDCSKGELCPAGTCENEKSGWLYSTPKQICPAGTQYKEVRPATN